MSSSYFPQQPPLASAQQFEPPPPPYTSYQSSYPPYQQPQQYQQPGAQSSSMEYTNPPLNQPPWNAPPTPAYTPSPYAHPDSQTQVSSPPTTQYFPPTLQSQPNQQQQSFGSGAQPNYNQPPANAPPTPALTPGIYGSTGPNPRESKPQFSSAPTAQYFPPPPPNQPNQQQQSFGSGFQSGYNQPPASAPPAPALNPGIYGSLGPNPGESKPQFSSAPTAQYFPPPPPNQQQLPPPPPFVRDSQPAFSQLPADAPPTPTFTPLSYDNSGPNSRQSSVSATKHFPQPPQVQPSLQQPPVANNSKPVYYQPPANSLTNPPHNSSNTKIAQSSPNGYPAEKQKYPQIQSQSAPPIAYSQAPQVLYVQSTSNQSTVNIQSNPLSPPPSTTQLYSGPGQLPQTYPPEKVQYQQQQPQFQQQPQAPLVGQQLNIQSNPLPPPPSTTQLYSGPGQLSQTSCPPEKVQYQQQPQFQQQPQILLVGQQQSFGSPVILQTQQVVNPAFPPVPASLTPGVSATPVIDDLKSSKTKRFFGDTLVGRAARSSVSTVTSTVKLPASLSPWGDNNPVTLPNVRYRDAALFATFHVIGGPLVDGVGNLVTDTFGADTFISEIVSSGTGFITGNTIVKYGVFQIVEQAIDKGVLEKILPEVEKTMRTTTAKSMQVAVKHKLMGVEADLRFVGTYPTTSLKACDKGWFCPYLYASSREPVIARSQDFAIAQFFGPYITADTALTHKLLTESASVIPLCDPNPTLRLPYSRLLVLFTGITPFRAGMWSTSRRPGCAQLIFHLLNGCPALVLPVCTAKTPVLAWSPWTLDQMQNFGVSGYKPDTQHRQITDWLMQLVERPGLYPCVRDAPGAFERLMGKVVTMIINSALAVPKAADGKVFGKVDVERAGVVMFRY